MLFRALNSVIQIPPPTQSTTMLSTQTATQLMVAHVDAPPKATERVSPYSDTPFRASVTFTSLVRRSLHSLVRRSLRSLDRRSLCSLARRSIRSLSQCLIRSLGDSISSLNLLARFDFGAQYHRTIQFRRSISSPDSISSLNLITRFVFGAQSHRTIQFRRSISSHGLDYVAQSHRTIRFHFAR